MSKRKAMSTLDPKSIEEENINIELEQIPEISSSNDHLMNNNPRKI